MAPQKCFYVTTNIRTTFLKLWLIVCLFSTITVYRCSCNEEADGPISSATENASNENNNANSGGKSATTSRPSLCPQGWLERRGSLAGDNACYHVMKQKNSCETALHQCEIERPQGNGAYLLSIHSYDEKTFILELVSKMQNDMGDEFFIGLHRRIVTRLEIPAMVQWTWADGTNFSMPEMDILQWDSDNPSQDRGGRCAVLNRRTGQIRDVSASSEYPFVCKYKIVSPADDSSDNSILVAWFCGILVGLVVAVVLGAVVYFCLLSRKKNRRSARLDLSPDPAVTEPLATSARPLRLQSSAKSAGHCDSGCSIAPKDYVQNMQRLSQYADGE